MGFSPRDLSRRAASAARFFLFLAAAGVAGCAAEKAPALPRLTIDPDRVVVAGVSSGAYMAAQAHVAFSDRLAGAVLVAGGPYGCAGGSLDAALGPCMTATPSPPDAEALAGIARTRASAGDIAPLSGLHGDRVFVLHGARDAIVSPALAQSSAAFYRALPAEAAVELRVDAGRAFGHVLPVATDTGVDCITGGTPYLGACDFDAAGEALAFLFGPAEAASSAGGELRHFDQSAHLPDGVDAQLADDGLLYVPRACAAGETCGLLVVFHGCQQNGEAVGDVFARDAGFNRWADRYRLAVLYPQTRASYLPLNPKACWDWWGYTGTDYDTRRGAQLRWLAAASAALGAPLE